MKTKTILLSIVAIALTLTTAFAYTPPMNFEARVK